MDTVQLAQMVTWLDEEHRKDRAEIARLQQKLDAQAVELQEQARRIQELEGNLASTQAQLTRFGQLEQAIEQLKNEVVAMVDRIKEDVLQAEREMERTRLSDREATARAISEIRRELPRFKQIEEELNVRRAEDQRLSEQVVDLRQQVATVSKQIEERTRSLPYLAEQRNQDAKHISQLQQETIELFKRIDAVASRLPLLEANIQKAVKAAEEVLPVLAELKRSQDSLVERVKLIQADQERQLQDFRDEIAVYREAIEAQRKHFQELKAAAEESKRAVQELEQVRASIQREQTQVAELQRLAEERQRKALETFQEEHEKRWQRELLNWQQRWREQEQFNQQIAQRFSPLEARLKEVAAHIEHLWQLQEEYGSYRLHEAQRWLDTLEEALEKREQIRGDEEAP